ncbi:MAG: hypothetical protein Q9195_004327 [Heterodermia aff. obscurata]
MSPSQDDPRNPFEAFRRFADEQMSALLMSLTGRPPNAPKPRPSESSESDEDLPWILRGTSEEARRRYRKAQREMNEYVSEQEAAAAERLEAHNDERPRCPYRPADQETPQRDPIYSNKCVRDRTDESDNDSSWAEDEPGRWISLTWPTHSLFTSDYSPLYLEKELRSQGDGQKWRHAFEDLIAIQSGMDMENRNSTQAKQCSGNWIGSRLHRDLFGAPRHEAEHVSPHDGIPTSAEEAGYSPEGIHYPVRHMQRAQSPNEPEREQEGEPDEDNEYDDYDTDEDLEDEAQTLAEIDQHIFGLNGRLFNTDFMQRLASQAFREVSQQLEHNSTSMQATDDDDKAKPSLISTFTTTERTTLPDGSVHTKMVLKKRFADGREENTETTHTTRDRRPAIVSEKADVARNGKADEAETPRQKAKGWFWA